MLDDFAVSLMREMVNEGNGIPFRSVTNFEEAKQTESAVLIMEGDWGGQIYMTCPMKYVNASLSALRKLLVWFDSLCWRELEGASINCEVIPVGGGVAGGMGGGVVVDGLWLHRRLEEQGVRGQVEEILRRGATGER